MKRTTTIERGSTGQRTCSGAVIGEMCNAAAMAKAAAEDEMIAGIVVAEAVVVAMVVAVIEVGVGGTAVAEDEADTKLRARRTHTHTHTHTRKMRVHHIYMFQPEP